MYSTSFKLFILISLFLVGCGSDDMGTTEPDPELPIGEFIDEWTYKIFPKPADNFDIAEFRLWLPEDRNNLRGIIILTHSRNSNGLGLALASEWQEYAISKKLGLLAVHFKGSAYTAASGGSGKALLTALEKITEKHTITEINKLPFLMRGYSAGGSFSYNFAEFRPKRVICYVNIRGSNGINVDSNSLIKDIPGLILVGELESLRADNIRNSVLPERRNLNHLLGYAVEPNTAHYGNLRNSDALVRTFFSSAVAQRLSVGTNELNTIIESTGWLGDNNTTTFFPFNNYPNAKHEASWLLDETFATHWKVFQEE